MTTPSVPTTSPGSPPAVIFEPIQIEVINEAPSVISNTEIQSHVDAMNLAGPKDFAKYWGTYALLTFNPQATQPDPSKWWAAYFDTSDQAGALGYHDLTDAGLPLAKIFAGTDKQYGASPSVTFSHEIWEILGDPYCSLAAVVESQTGIRLYAYETADAVEADNLAYTVNGVPISDFVTPDWFLPQTSSIQGVKFDLLGHVSQPFQLAPGGYISYLDASSPSGWQQLHADKAELHYHDRPRLGSRRERRRTPRDQWLPSRVLQK